jgi:hypothetical protein
VGSRHAGDARFRSLCGRAAAPPQKGDRDHVRGPALIVFPGQLIAVSDASQTEEFFASTWSQYEGVDAADPQILIMGEAPGTVWADVTCFYGGRAQERFCYQLVAGPQNTASSVLTRMA